MLTTITIEMDNSTFHEYTEPSYEVARILRKLAERIEGHPHYSPGHSQPLYDLNGNKVGYLDVTEEAQTEE